MKDWYVLYTKPKHEKKVMVQLTNLGVNAYCPMIKSVRQWSDRKKKVESPLIPSCVFIQSKEVNRKDVFQIPGAVRYLFWLGKPAIVKNNEIEQMKLWLQGEIIDATIENLRAGDNYKVPDGHFKGENGIVKEIGKNRLQIVLVDLNMKISISRKIIN